MHPVRVKARRLPTWSIVAAALMCLSVIGGLTVQHVGVARAEARSLVEAAQLALKSGDATHAALQIERAALVAPRADFVRGARASSHVRAADSWLIQKLGVLSPREWAWLALGFGWAAGLGVAVSLGGKNLATRRPASRLRKAIYAAALLFTVAAALTFATCRSASRLAVVNRATGALVSPYAGAGAMADLAPGMVVSMGARYGDFVQIHGPDGTQGWIDRKALELVVGS